MNGECNATNVQGKNYNLHKLQGGHVPQCPIAGDATGITDTKLLIVKRKMKFVRKYCNSENGLCILFADAASLERKMLAI